MRIAHVTATFPPYYAGTGNVCYHNARELARRGHEVHVFTAAMNGASAREACDGFIVRRLPALFRMGNMPILPSLTTALRGFDIVHLHYPFIIGAEMVRLAAALHRTPLVVSFHNDLIGAGLRARIFKLYQSISAHLVIRGAARLCVLSLDHFESSRLYQSLAHRGPNLVELPNGVDLNVFHPGNVNDRVRERYDTPKSVKIALFVAALDRAHHFKGLEILLQAIQTIPTNVSLLVVGDGDLREDYERQAQELGISNRVIFTGAIQHEELPPYFRSADVTVLPSLHTESFGLVLIESLACGTPVVATKLPGVRTVVEDGKDGLLVEPGSTTSLTDAIRKILSEDTVRKAMGNSGRAKVELRYGWRQLGASLEKIYQQVLTVDKVSSQIYHV